MRAEIEIHHRRHQAVRRPAEEASLTSTRRVTGSPSLNRQAEDPNLWNDPQRASRVMQERTALDDQLNALSRIDRNSKIS